MQGEEKMVHTFRLASSRRGLGVECEPCEIREFMG